MQTGTRKDIIKLPNPALRQRSKKIGIVDEKVLAIIEFMQQATIDWEKSRDHEVSVALAAVQADILYRIVIIRDDFDDKDNQNFQVFINPEITKYEGQLVNDYEGCLSIKNVYGLVPRYDKVRVKALNISGKPIKLSATGFLSRIFQHEIDHTNGKLFIDHIKDDPDAFFMLTSDGKLEKLDYQKVISDEELWT
ncbi:peptide deformylase [Candidatus Saccharibacteria bacterium]|nr:peptide deformylase [Candidatus Saccharibacteria bacterium]